MDEFEKKLHSNNPIIVAQIISSLITSIKTKKEKGELDSKILELKFLKTKCLERDSYISEVSGLGLVKLIEENILQLDSVLKEVLLGISSTSYLPSFIKLVGSLLRLEAQNNIKLSKCVCTYNLHSPKHPFVTLINEKPSSAQLIVHEISNFFKYHDPQFATELFTPVFLYSLYDENVDLNLLKPKLWSFILKSTNKEIVLHDQLLQWINLRNLDNLLTKSEIFAEILEQNVNHNKVELFALWQAITLHYITFNQSDPLQTISSLTNTFKNVDHLTVSNCILVILSSIVKICSPLYLLDLLQLCDVIVKNQLIQKYALNTLKASILQWIANPNCLIPDSFALAKNLLNCSKESSSNVDLTKFWTENYDILICDTDSFITVQFCSKIAESTNDNELLNFVQTFSNSSYPFLKRIIHLVYGLFIEESSNDALALELFKIMAKYAEYYRNSASEVIVLILYKLTITKSPKLHLKLLKTMSRLVYTTEDMKKVIITFQVFCEHNEMLHNFGLALMLDAWKVNDKCFPYLEKQIVEDCKFGGKMDWWITKSYVLKEICRERPEIYGKDIVAHLSKILSKSSNANYTLPCVLAIEGISFLCKAGVVDIITTWTILEPMFKEDKRVAIIQALCQLLGEVPNLPYFEAYRDEQVNNFVRILWGYVLTSSESKVVEAALQALLAFDLEQISTEFPECYLDEETIVLKKKSRNQQLFFIPGNAWIRFLERFDANNLNWACNFIIQLMIIEISNYKKYVYDVKSAKEPFSLDYLPNHSVVRGIGEFVRVKSTKWKGSLFELIYLKCLGILSNEYPKQLPPLNWCFIQELFHQPETKLYCIDLASHQVVLSGTARRFMENVITGCSEEYNREIAMRIYKNMKYLANSIQPMILKPFFETSFNSALEDKELLDYITTELMEVLENKNIEDTNKYTIANTVVNKSLYLPWLTAFPLHFFKKMNFLSNLKTDEFITCICSVATQSKAVSLSWINDLVINNKIIDQKKLVLTQLVPVFKKYRHQVETTVWLFNLMGQIQTDVAHENPEQENLYLIDILIESVLVFSECDLFIDSLNDVNECLLIFPQAFGMLVEDEMWRDSKGQTLEWLYFMNCEESVPPMYRKSFGKTIQALKHNSEFVKNKKWMKYISCKV